MKVKLFSFPGTSLRQFPEAEDQLNAWLSERGEQIEIVEIQQSVGGGSWAPPVLVVSIWYRERGAQMA